ncbi:hypothetical protein LSAT2_024217 [Lamellibrachia satsuma]|nr:hypothetical protein LSAT2_024217 [Lamellibrachia satsuma]
MQSDEQTVKISIDIGVCTQKSVVVHTISVKTHENYALLIRSSLTLKASLSNEGRRVTMPDFRNKSSSSILVVFLIVFQLSTGVAQRTLSPRNTAVRLGETIRLACLIRHPADTVVFTVTIVGNNETVEIGQANESGTFVTEQFASSHTLYYASELPTISVPLPRNETPSFNETETNPSVVTGTPNLTEPRSVFVEVVEAHYDSAGTYACRSQLSSATFLAEVVVLGDIECDNDLKDNQVMAGETFHMTCRLAFSGRMTPVLQWFDNKGPISGGHRRVIVNSHLFGSVSSSFRVQATDALHGHRYTCDATVLPTNTTPPDGGTFSQANNKPDYLIRYNSAPVVVLHAPRIKLIPSWLRYHVGDSLTVAADARPAVHGLVCLAVMTDKEYRVPSGEHYDGTSSKPVEATISITEAMLGGETFHCMAVNIIDGVEYMTTKIIRIEVFKAFKSDSVVASFASSATVRNTAVILSGLLLLTLL